MAESKKVLKKNIGPGLSFSNDISIDRNMLEMLKQLDLPHSELGFDNAIVAYSEKIFHSLKLARQYLLANDNIHLEETALELSQHALRVGAVKILRSAFDLQNVARCKDFNEAKEIVNRLELEYLRVRRDLESVI